jgi:polyphosphate glucokinase
VAVLGIDVGGSSIKAGVVEINTGSLIDTIASKPTPQPATPDAVMQAIIELAVRSATKGPIGLAFPAVIKHGKVCTAANIDPAWIGVAGAKWLQQELNRPVAFLNDADAAGLAEVAFGAGRNLQGTVLMLTLGTGIGTALFVDGKLYPNSELGHLPLRSADAEQWAAARVRTELNLSWSEWAARVNEYLALLHDLLWPDVFIIGGAVSEHFTQFAAHLQSPAKICAAQLTGQAGVIGAALATGKS